MNNETMLHDALAKLLPAFHLTLDGKPEAAAVYRSNGERSLFESNIPIATWEIFQVYVYQREYDPALIAGIRSALKTGGFTVETIGAQVMQDDYYRDELRLSKLKEE